MGKIIRKTSCGICGSKDNKAEYDDGTFWCFTPDCDSNRRKNNVASLNFKTEDLPFGTEARRKIKQSTAEMFGVRRSVSSDGGTDSVHYPYYEGNNCVGYKVRTVPKDFKVRGVLPSTLFGQHCFTAGGKRIVITEGEEDTLAIAEAYSQYGKGTIYPVVSMPSASNTKAIVEQREYIRSFDEIILLSLIHISEPTRPY